MTRLSPFIAVALALTAACNPKAPAPADTRRAAGERTASAAPVEAPPPGEVAELPPPDPRERALSATVLHLLEQEHLLDRKIDDSVSRLAFDSYLEAIDGGKMFLLEADATGLASHATTIDDELRRGALDLAHEGAKLFQARVAVVEKIVERVLGQPMNLDDEEYVELDPDKLTRAKTDDELADRWRRRLELEVLERVASMEARLAAEAERAKARPGAGKPAGKTRPPAAAGSGSGSGNDQPPTAAPRPDDDDDEGRGAGPVSEIPDTAAGREAKARADLAKTYAGRFARLKTPAQIDASADLINAVAAALDPHTTYMPPADKANFDIRMSGSLEGIGAVLREKDHLIEVVEIVPGGASWRHGGLSAGDLILSVQQDQKDPVDVFDMRIDEVVKMIRGPKGTVVHLRIKKPAGTDQTIAITRDVVVIEESYAKSALLQARNKPVTGYIHLPSFYGGKTSPRASARDLQAALTEMKAKKVGGVILDLRGNGGGLLGDAIEITGQLIDRGPVVQVKGNDGQKEVLSDDARGVAYDGPVIVLVDQFSASASEILAGALQDYERAIIVGTGPTHGKGTVQTIADLDRATGGSIELGVLKITIQQFFRPSGSSVQREGVTPDIVLPNPAAHIDSGERELRQAIAWSQIAPAPFTRWSHPWSTKELAARSAARVARHPLLAKIASATKLLRERRNDTRVPLARAAWEARRKEQKAALEAASPDLKKAPPGFSVKPLTEPAAGAPTPAGPGRTDDSAARWRENLSKDPWVEESVQILADMMSAR